MRVGEKVGAKLSINRENMEKARENVVISLAISWDRVKERARTTVVDT